jgi:protein subunit release factor B
LYPHQPIVLLVVKLLNIPMVCSKEKRIPIVWSDSVHLMPIISVMRSGAAGGQNVNKVNSAVRIEHLPSGRSVKCTQERSKAMNMDIAMKRLKAQLLAIAKEQRVAHVQEIGGVK